MMINKRLLSLVPEAKKQMILKVLVNWFSLLLGIVMWFTLGNILQLVFNNNFKNSDFLFFIIIVGCIIGRYFLIGLSSKFTHQATELVKIKFRGLIFDKIIDLKGDYSEKLTTSEIIQLSGEGVEQLEIYFGNYLPQFFFALIAPITLFFVYLPFSWLSAVVLFVCVPLIPMAIIFVQKIAKKLLSKYWGAYANLGDSFLENLQGLTTLKVYNADQKYHDDMNKDAEHFRKITMKVLTMQLNSVTIMDLVAYGGTALGSLFIALAYSNENISIGIAIAMILLASEFFLAMRALGSFFHVAMNGMAASDRMFKLLDMEESVEGSKVAKNGELEIKNLSFAYDKKQVLSNIKMNIKNNNLVGVCGESGSGKSTLAKLIAGELYNYSGKITLARSDYKTLNKKSLKQLITVVSANSYIFKSTVRETLLTGKADANSNTLMKVLKQVALWDFLENEGGLDFKLSENASNISGGQKQRLALARALLKDSKIYIFDEATSNIDVESETKINEIINSLKSKHTVIVISHRLANIANADTIYFLEKGKIIESGKHLTLIANELGYYDMFTKQKELESIREVKAHA